MRSHAVTLNRHILAGQRRHPEGKLRLLYECSPLAYLVEQAGGGASTGRQRILDVKADSIHQRVPLVIGSAGDVLQYESFLKDGDSP